MTSTRTSAFYPREINHRRGCTCGGCSAPATLPELLESAIVGEILAQSDGVTRRAFVQGLGRTAFLAALGSVLPLDAMKAAVGDKLGPPEKTDLKIGFIPITCATPIIMADPLGYYAKNGLKVEVIKTAGWAVIRDKTLANEYDAAHMLAPMPLAISLGVGSTQVPYRVAAIENINGQAITLALAHKDKRDPKQWKGFKFAIPFEYSMHNFLLRYYLAEAGLDPDQDVQIRVIPPPEMVANMRAGNIDGCLAPDPVNQRAVFEGVGFIHLLSKDIWDGHPCCTFAASEELATKMPNTFGALLRSIVDATEYASKAENRAQIAEAIAPKNYLNQPPEVVAAVLTGKYPDGLGNVIEQPKRIDFAPFPYPAMAVWILTQMKRWGYLKGDVNYKTIAEQVFRAAECGAMMKDLGFTPPAEVYPKFRIMGKEFDPAKASEYLASFPMRKS